jgi:heme exporter protein CcmD
MGARDDHDAWGRTLMELLSLGNYGAYVWACFGLTLIIVVLSDWHARVRHKQVYRDIEVRIKALEERQ